LSNGGDQNAEFDTDEDSLNEIVMAVNIRDRSTVGCSYYVAREEKLYFMKDIILGGLDIIEACKISTSGCHVDTNMKIVKLYNEPTVVLVSTRMEDAIIDRLDPDAREEILDR